MIILSPLQRTLHCDWLLYYQSANENICCSRCCEVQKSCTRLLSGALAARVVDTWRGGVQHNALGGWHTDLYNCTLILSQTLGFTIFPHSHVHDPTRDLAKSTPFSVNKTLVALPCCCALHFLALWSSDSKNYSSSSLYKKSNNRRLRSCSFIKENFNAVTKF